MSDTTIGIERCVAELQIRRELIDMCRHYHGPLGQGANHFTIRYQGPAEASAQPQLYDRAETTEDPRKMQEWADFHATVQDLPEGDGAAAVQPLSHCHRPG